VYNAVDTRLNRPVAIKAVHGSFETDSTALALTGQLPFEGLTKYEYIHSLLTRPRRSPSALAPHVPEELARVLTRCLARDPTDPVRLVRRWDGGVLRVRPGP
jgi:serine/threonine protein kinase